MRGKRLLASAALIFCLTGCGAPVHERPAPVLNLDFRGDSAGGAMIVRGRDTVWRISQRYRLPVRGIIDLNNLQPPYRLVSGQRLKLPTPVDYRVREGDTLEGISNMFVVGMSRLVSVNRLPAPYRIVVGQVLRIPSLEESRKTTEKESPPYKPESAAVAREVLPPPSAARTFRRQPREEEAPVLAGGFPRFVWPVRGKVISSYGAKDDGLYNDGINIAAPRGTPVAAAAEGIVAYVGHDLKSYGNLILIRHGGGAMTAYAHLGAVTVKRGMTVRRGQAIGIVGSTGAVPTAQLHFEIRQATKALDPIRYLG